MAPWDGQEILRVVAVANRGGAILRRIRVQAFVRAPGERIQRIETLVRQGGSLQWFGLVNEFYGPDGTPNQHNLRPFETGPLTEALIVTNSSTEKEAARGL